MSYLTGMGFAWLAAGWVFTVRAAETNWAPAPSPLMTRWSKNVAPDNVHLEYPRPRIVRKDWLNLNGLWDCAFSTGPHTNPPAAFDRKILVPFPVESALSGVGLPLTGTNRLWYRHTFVLPAEWAGRQVWLRFGAIDWECSVWVNDILVGKHRGGFDAFGFDITPALKPERGEQEIRIYVSDWVEDPMQVVGKQRRYSQDTFYSRVSGIWQTVWLEPVPALHVKSLSTVPLVDDRAVEFTVEIGGDAAGAIVEAYAVDGDTIVGSVKDVPAVMSPTNSQQVVARFRVPLTGMKLWNPEQPFLYDARIRVVKGGQTVDEVKTYFGMRKISLDKDARGRWRMLFNGEPLFQLGILDEGYWPDGLYTAPTDEALRFDIETAKRLGFNMCRKHVKVEPERWYYWCDKLGMLVWQDMPNGQVGGTAMDRPRAIPSALQFEVELARMIQGRSSHPCIIGWVLFNQGWGQFDTARLTRKAKELDPTRLVIGASGWVDRGVGDVRSEHIYPSPEKLDPDPARALFLGEFGGFGVTIAEHAWTDRVWSHRPLSDQKLLPREYEQAVNRVILLKESAGLSGAVFTQLTDVEQEVTGLLTYDREVLKMDADTIIRANAKAREVDRGK